MTAKNNYAPIPWAWYLAGLVSALVSFAYALTYFDQVPDPMPVHFNASGEADSFVAKTLTAFLGMHLLPLAIFLLAGVGSAGLIQVQARSAAEDTYPTRSNTQRQRSVTMLRGMQKPLAGFLLALMVMISVGMHMSFGAWGPVRINLFWLLAGIIVVCAGLILITSRLQRRVDEQYPPEDEKETLRWGMVYFNRDDERVFIDQLGGTNLTLNFARPGAWGVLAALFIPLAIAVGGAFLAS